MRQRSRVTAKGWARRPRRFSPVAVAGMTLGVLAVLALMLAGLGAQWGWWNFRTGFRILRWAAYGGAFAALVSLLGAMHARPAGPRRGFAIAMVGLVVGLGAVGLPWQWQRTARSVPPIHDITTDTENPPEFAAILPLRANAPNPVEYGGPELAAQQRAAYPDVQPVLLEMPFDLAFDRALDAARSMRWEIVSADSAAGRIEATDRTFWFGFADDVVIRVTPAGGGSRLDARSISRVGGSDVGTNARRLRRYLDRVRQ